MTRTIAIRRNPARLVALGLVTAAAALSGQVADASAADVCRGELATIEGTTGADRLTGTAARDVISARAGHDVIDGAGGNDVICGGDGDDRVAGGSGTDILDGGTGNDACSAGETNFNCQPGMQTTFMPTRHGFPFANQFTAIPTYVTPLGTIGLDYGLCGGMAFAALDNWRVDDVAPGTATTPQSGQTFDYLWSRLLDSLTIDIFHNLYRFNDLQWKSNADLAAISNAEVAAIKTQLQSRPTPVGVIIPAAGQPIWGNHQVLAIGWFNDSDGTPVLKLYDPNTPDTISYLDVAAKTLNGTPIRGFFGEHYNARTAPWN